MKIILLHDIPRLGRKSDIKNVADGHALHFLIPRGLAIEATVQNLAQHKKKQEIAVQHKENESEAYETLRRELEERVIIIYKPADAKGNLYAGVNAKDIVHALRASNALLPISFRENNIIIDAPIKTAGEHHVTIKNPSGNFILAIRVEPQEK